MRPLRLTLKGLRSYREEQEIDFESAGLIAIVGDTGAGKSSLLEALTVALYGTSTWDARETKQLISDGAQTMLVSLTFRADGKLWRVERGVSRGTYPPARHALECLDGSEKLDKKDPVDARIRQLVGLDYEAFLRSVVLPQGRFAALLQAKPSERASILKGILRIDRLDVVREQARSAKDRMTPIVAALKEQRGKLLPDPAAAESDAATRLTEATKVRDFAAETQQKLAAAKEKRRIAEERQKHIQGQYTRANEGKILNLHATFRDLNERDEAIAKAVAENEAQLVIKRAEEEDLSQTIAEAEQKGAGPVSLSEAKNALTALHSEVPLLAEEASSIEKEDEALLTDVNEQHQSEQQLTALIEQEATAKKEVAEAKALTAQAAEALESAKRSLKDYRGAEAEKGRTAQKVEKARAEVEKAKEQLNASELAAKKAEEKFSEVDGALRAATQKHAAAHAAADKKAGDPCPVCERPLPDGYKAPKPAALETVQKKLDKAKTEVDGAREKLAVFRSKLSSAEDKFNELSAEFDERCARVNEITLMLNSLLNYRRDQISQQAVTQPGIVSVGAESPEDDSVVLNALIQSKEGRTLAQNESEITFQKVRDEMTRLKAETSSKKKRIAERKEGLKKAKDALNARRKRLQETVQKMAPDLRPKAPYPSADIAALTAKVEVRRLKISKVLAELDDVRTGRRARGMEQTRLTEQRQKEVSTKVAELELRLATYAERLSLLATSLSKEGPTRRPESASLEALASWAEGFEESATTLLLAAEDLTRTLAREVLALETEQKETLLASGVKSEEELQAALLKAETMKAEAEKDLARARNEKPIALGLDKRIATSESLLSALQEVTRLVADGKLIHHVVHRRQRVLLSVASELLGSMTRDRYGFSEDFEVVDKVSGQARGTRTLSGGETFLASLSLSLALVELAGRSGGRLEALFLDEGFGSLDASSLGEALDALTQKAEGGRLVAVISHLRSVAESIDRVLSVRMTPTGSVVKWISADEREKMLSEDVQQGLVS